MLAETIKEALERQARQQMLNQALYHLVEKAGGSVTVPISVLADRSMGGIAMEVNPQEGTVKLSAITQEAVEAFVEKVSNETESH